MKQKRRWYMENPHRMNQCDLWFMSGTKSNLYSDLQRKHVRTHTNIWKLDRWWLSWLPWTPKHYFCSTEKKTASNYTQIYNLINAIQIPRQNSCYKTHHGLNQPRGHFRCILVQIDNLTYTHHVCKRTHMMHKKKKNVRYVQKAKHHIIP